MQDNKITELENKINELKLELEELKKPKTNRRWKPKENERYYTTTHFGEVENYTWSNHEYDNLALDGYNCFQTREQAEQHLENIKTKNELRALAEELNGDKVIDWSCPSLNKFELALSNDTLYQNRTDSRFVGGIYCLDVDFKDKAIERIGKERLINMIKSGV